MVTLTAAADSWKSWLDDAPLPETFNSATGGLQDFITALSRALLASRAELARVRADAAVAVALMVERAADEINLRRHLLANVQNVVIPKPEELAIYDICEEAIRALAPADTLAAENASLKAAKAVAG